MSLPRVWARLPGPADFLDTILEDLTDRVTVLAGLPDEIPAGELAIEIADAVKYTSLGQWQTVRSSEVRSSVPTESLARRSDAGNASGAVLWVDAAGTDEGAAAWAGHARRFGDSPDMPRLCIVMNEACAGAHGEEKRLRRRLWRDFVTPLDSRALVERTSRRAGHRQPHVALKSALISEIARDDLTFADRLSRDPLGRILESREYARECIWAAQVSVLLPLVEQERQRLLHIHEALWRIPHTRKDGTEIRHLHDLEIGDMAVQSQSGGLLERERHRLGWLRRVRNALAHNEVVPWATLTSPIAIQIMDFR